MSKDSLAINKVIPTIDELVDQRVANVSKDYFEMNNYIWRSGKGAILLHWMALASKAVAAGGLSATTTVFFVYLFFAFFQLWSIPYEMCQLYLAYFVPMLLLTGTGGALALSTGNLLEGKARDKALQLVANEREQVLLTGGNYIRQIESTAVSRLRETIYEELKPLYKRRRELKEELDTNWKAWKDTQRLVNTPTKKQLLEKIDADIKTADGELRQVEDKITLTRLEMASLQTQIEQLAAHAPLLDVQHKRMLREDKDLVEADAKRRGTLDDIRSEVESAIISVQVESGIGLLEEPRTKKIENKE